jgi:hypothetical protein
MPKISSRQLTISQIDTILRQLILSDSFESSPFYEQEINELMELKAHILSYRYFDRARESSIPKSLEHRTLLLTLPNDEFRQAFRMNKDTFVFILNKIEAHEIFKNAGTHKQQPVWVQLLVALERFGFDGNACSVGKVARNMGISSGTVILFSNRVIEALVSIIPNWIKWSTPAQRKRTSRYFEENHNLKGCVGVLDGTLVNLCQKPFLNGETYWTRKQRYSMNVQIICNHKREIIYYQTGYPGSCHDSLCFKNTDICKHPEKYMSNGEYLLADAGYALSPNVVVPYRSPAGEELEFNRKFSSARIIIEHVMGLLKGRWSSLRGLRVKIHKPEDVERANRWIVAILVLHNIVMKFKDNWEEEIEEDETDIYAGEEINTTGIELRERVRDMIM